MPFRKETAGTTAKQIVAYNAERSVLAIRNVSGATVYISNDAGAITTEGWPMAPGDFVSFLKLYGDDTAAAVYAQTVAATTDMRIQESFGRVLTEAK